MARVLLDRGFKRVQALHGGFQAWQEAGLLLRQIQSLQAVSTPCVTRLPEFLGRGPQEQTAFDRGVPLQPADARHHTGTKGA